MGILGYFGDFEVILEYFEAFWVVFNALKIFKNFRNCGKLCKFSTIFHSCGKFSTVFHNFPQYFFFPKKYHNVLRKAASKHNFHFSCPKWALDGKNHHFVHENLCIFSAFSQIYRYKWFSAYGRYGCEDEPTTLGFSIPQTMAGIRPQNGSYYKWDNGIL